MAFKDPGRYAADAAGDAEGLPFAPATRAEATAAALAMAELLAAKVGAPRGMRPVQVQSARHACWMTNRIVQCGTE
jgi:hypothetical protein